MAERTRIQKGLRGDPLTWGHVVNTDGSRVGVRVTCPRGHAGHLDHDIAADGLVEPSLVCPVGGCDFHEFVQLVGWPDG